MNGYLLDTHAWLWAVQEAREQVSSKFFLWVADWQKAGQLYLSPISCWEIGLLIDGRRLTLDQPVEELWHRATEPDACRIAELTAPVLVESTRLPGKIHRDPADRILAATARHYELTLVTHDKKLLDYAKQGHIAARKI